MVKRERVVSKSCFDEIRGTKKHEIAVAKNRKYNKGFFDEVKCTKKYETGKAINQKVIISHFSGIRGIEKNKTVGEKAKNVVRVVLMKYDSQKSMKLVMQTFSVYHMVQTVPLDTINYRKQSMINRYIINGLNID